MRSGRSTSKPPRLDDTWINLKVNNNHEIMTQKWKREIFLSPWGLNCSPLKLKASVHLMNYSGPLENFKRLLLGILPVLCQVSWTRVCQLLRTLTFYMCTSTFMDYNFLFTCAATAWHRIAINPTPPESNFCPWNLEMHLHRWQVEAWTTQYVRLRVGSTTSSNAIFVEFIDFNFFDYFFSLHCLQFRLRYL